MEGTYCKPLYNISIAPPYYFPLLSISLSASYPSATMSDGTGPLTRHSTLFQNTRIYIPNWINGKRIEYLWAKWSFLLTSFQWVGRDDRVSVLKVVQRVRSILFLYFIHLYIPIIFYCISSNPLPNNRIQWRLFNKHGTLKNSAHFKARCFCTCEFDTWRNCDWSH